MTYRTVGVMMLMAAFLSVAAIAGPITRQARVEIDKDGWLRVNGKSFLAIGMYNAGRYDEMAASGFNLVQSYNSTVGPWRADLPAPTVEETRTFLDRAAESGMYAIIGCPRRYLLNRDWDAIRGWTHTFKDHPALLCWEEEEAEVRGFVAREDLAKLCAIYREANPTRPVLIGDRPKDSDPVTDPPSMLPEELMDIGIWWWYPFGGPDAFSDPPPGTRKGRLEPPLWLGTTTSKKPLWVGLQAYKDENKKGYRFPTTDEYYCMAYTSLIYGAKGMIYFVGSGMAGKDGMGNGILNKPEEGRWEDVKALVSEMSRLTSALTAPVVDSQVTMTPKPAGVCFSLRRDKNVFYLIAANKDAHRSAVRFYIEGLTPDSRITELRESRNIHVRSGILEDVFPPYAVRVYRISPVR